MNVLITGGSGFLGHELCAALLETQTFDVASITLTDVNEPRTSWSDPRVKFVRGPLPETMGQVVSRDLDIVFALHGIMSGQSETDFDLGMKVNLDATRVLLEALRHSGSPSTKLIFTSTVAVYGGDFPVPADEQHIPQPQSSYGSAKACAELLVNEYSRRKWLDGRVLRVPTVSIRPGQPSSAASSYVSGIIREPLQGIEHICPVARDQPAWICPPTTVVRNLIHAATIPAESFGHSRTVNLPGLRITVDEQIEALKNIAPEAVKYIKFKPDQAVLDIVSTWIPELDVARAYTLGFEKPTSFESAIRDFIQSRRLSSKGEGSLAEENKSPEEQAVGTLNSINEDLIKSHPNLGKELVKEIARQELALRFTSISHENCLTLGLNLLAAVQSLPAQDFKPVVIEIELNGTCIFHYAMPGTSKDNQWWIERKQRTVRHFGKSSYNVGRALALEGKKWSEKYAGLEEGQYAAHGGCWPIQLTSGVTVGTITMSGLAQVLDHVVIVRTLARFLGVE